MKTIKDVAKLAGVSPATVSRVLNNSANVRVDTRRKIEEAIKALDFRPNESARALVRKNVKTIGVVISELADPFFAQMASAIESTAKKYGYRVLISTGSLDMKKERRAIESLIAQQCTALVVNSKALPDTELIKIANNNPGFVLINKYVEEIKQRCVWFDNSLGGELMARHAISLGHKRIAVLMTKNKVHDASRRLKGIRKEMATHGVRLSQQDVYYCQPDYNGAQQAVKDLISKTPPYSIILCYNDAVASGVIASLLDHGKNIPKDVSVMGFDDVLLAKYCSPKLTTIKYPISVMAAKATELALVLATPKAEQIEQLGYCYKPYLVQRQSVTSV